MSKRDGGDGGDSTGFLALMRSAAFSATAYKVACRCAAGTKGMILPSTILSCLTP